MNSKRIGWAAAILAFGLISCDRAPSVAESPQLRLKRLQDEVLDLRDAGRGEEAVAVLGEMAELDPQNPWAYELAVRIHSAPPRFDEAERLMRSWATEGPALDYGLAQIDYRKGRCDNSLEALEETLAEYRGLQHLAGQAFSHKAIGICHLTRGRRDEADTALQEARRLFAQLDDGPWVANVLMYLAFVERGRKQYDTALGLLEEALEIQTRVEDPRGQAETWKSMGAILKVAGDYDRAVEAVEESVAIRRRTNDLTNLYSTLQALAQVHLRFDRDDLALKPLLEAAEIARELGDPKREHFRRIDAGRLLSQAGRHREALEQLELARSAAMETGSPRRRVSVEVFLCAALRKAGRHTDAIEQARATAEFASENDLQAEEAAALTTQANALQAVGRLHDALLAQERALELYRTLEDSGGVITSLNNLAAFQYYLGDAKSAERQYEESLGLVQKLRESDETDRAIRHHEARVRNGLGVVLASQDRFEEARAQQLSALELWDGLNDAGSAAHARLNLAGLEWKANRPVEAGVWAGDALSGFREVGDREGECFALNNQASAFSQQGRHDEALAASAEALGLAREFGLRRALRISHGVRARVHEAAGHLAEALAEYRSALDMMESQRVEMGNDELKMRFFTNTNEVYERAVDLQARVERVEDPSARQAFRLAERARVRALLDLLAESAGSMRQSLPPELLEREQTLIDQVSAAEVRHAGAAGSEEEAGATEELEEAEKALDRFKLEIRERAPEYAQVVYPDPIDLTTLQRDVLRDDETLLRYFFGPDRALLWIVDRRQARFFELGDVAEIASLVDRFLARASHPGTGLAARPEGEGLAEELAEKLLTEPLPAGRRLLVVADGPLLRLPFEVLRRDGRYLVEDHEIAVIPSASVLGLMRESAGEHAADGFLGLGDPLEPAGEASFPQLPASGQALDRIAGLFSPQARMTLLRESCTKQALRGQPLDRFRFVHFATHGWLIAENPPRIGLRLSPATEGGPASFLSMNDVFPLDLAAELVVLSGCQTGLGELLPGEGLVGLTRAFLYAGSRSVLVSLWNVSDRSTAEFMETFYSALDGNTVPEALRQARLSFIRSGRPAQRQFYRWAPFVLIGDPGTTAVELNPERISSKKGTDGGG